MSSGPHIIRKKVKAKPPDIRDFDDFMDAVRRGVVDTKPTEETQMGQKIWSDKDFRKRNRRPFIPHLTAGLTEPETMIKELASFETHFFGQQGEERAKAILETMGLKPEHLVSYPTLDINDPDFWEKFSFFEYMTNSRYAMESFMYIDTKDQGIQPFKLNPVQLAFQFNRSGRDVVLKARQHGLTTVDLGDKLWDTMLNPGRLTAILTHEREASQLLLERVKLMYDRIPTFLKPPLQSNTKDRIVFKGMDGSQIIVQVIRRSAKSADNSERSGGSGRSKRVHNLLLSEPAFYEGVQDKDLLGLLESVAPTGSVLIESTPNGVGGFYYEEVEAAKKPKNARKLFIFHWTLNPEYDDKWKANKQRERLLDPSTEEGRRNWAQEYECDFLQSQASYFPPEICTPSSKFQERIPYIWIQGQKNIYPDYIHIFCEPEPGELYVAGVDAAQGLEWGDYSSMTILSRTTRCEVAQIYGKIRPEPFTELVRWAGEKYNNAFIGVENERNGMVVIHGLLRDRDHMGNLVDPYENLFFYRNEYSIRRGSDGQPGWSTNSKTRPVMLAELRKVLTEDTVQLAFGPRTRELREFTIIDGKPQARAKSNDDLVISAAIAVRMLDFPDRVLRYTDLEFEVRAYG